MIRAYDHPRNRIHTEYIHLFFQEMYSTIYINMYTTAVDKNLLSLEIYIYLNTLFHCFYSNWSFPLNLL